MTAGDKRLTLLKATAAAAITLELLGLGADPPPERKRAVMAILAGLVNDLERVVLEDLLVTMGLAGYEGPFTVSVHPGSVCQGEYHAHYDPSGAPATGHELPN